MRKVIVYVEAVAGPQGAAWGVVLMCGGRVKRLGGCGAKTVPAALLEGARAGLEALRCRCAVEVVTTSQYLVQGMTEWLPVWRAHRWMGHRGPVANREAWEALAGAARAHEVRWHWVRKGEGGLGEREARAMAARAARGGGAPEQPDRGPQGRTDARGLPARHRPGALNPFGWLVARAQGGRAPEGRRVAGGAA